MDVTTRHGRRRGRLISLTILALAVAAWFSLGRWVPDGSERFYLLVPPVGLALSSIFPGAGNGWRLGHVPVGAIVWLLLGVACIAYNLTLTAPLFADGPLAGLSVREVVLALYFLLALKLLLHLPRRLLRALAGRVRLPAFGAEVVATAAVVPFLVGPFYAHRFKVPNPERPAELADRPFENVEFTTADGFTLRGWFIPARSPSPRTLLICHGMGANRSTFLTHLPVGDGLGANVLLFDFRGHGDSDGHTVSFGDREQLDVLAAVEYLRTRRSSQARQVIGLGVSMGAASLTGAAARVEPPLDAVVLDSGFANAWELTDSILGWLPASVRPFLAGPALPLVSLDAGCWVDDVRPEESIGRLRAPVFVIHARGDRLVPVAHAERLYARAAVPKALWLTDTGGHGSAFRAGDEYVRRIAAWVAANVASPESVGSATPRDIWETGNGSRRRQPLPAMNPGRSAAPTAETSRPEQTTPRPPPSASTATTADRAAPATSAPRPASPSPPCIPLPSRSRGSRPPSTSDSSARIGDEPSHRRRGGPHGTTHPRGA
jgi:alpha-beta hydrolase superfamily lysophospholipase